MEGNDQIQARLEKRAKLLEKGIDPYGGRFEVNETITVARTNPTPERDVRLAGRLMSHRDMGKSMFADLKDSSGRIQLYVQKKVLNDEQFDLFKHFVDLGDLIGVTGKLFVTHAGELTVRVESFTILSKAIRPLPKEHFGLKDTETRLRQRYLDLWLNEKARETFLLRSKIVGEIRKFLDGRGFVEVETPMMQPIAGGAAAEPFKTHHNALDIDLFLRVAPELYLKRLLVGGFEKVYEINRNFRNEGISRRHNPEFTMLEVYQAYGDFETMMDLVQGLVCNVAQKVNDGLLIWHPKTSEIRNLLNQTNLFLKKDCNRLFEFVDKEKLIDVNNLLKPLEMKIEEAEKSLSVLHPEVHVSVAEKAGSSLLEFRDLLFRVFSDNEEVEYLRRRFDALTANFYELSKEKIIDLTPPWRRITYREIIEERIGKDWFTISPGDRKLRATQMRVEFPPDAPDYEVTNAIFEKTIEPTLMNPTFVTHLPAELVVLAKPNKQDAGIVDVFELIINGQEIAPAYSELNDPVVQRARLLEQAAGHAESLDEDFLTALEHGMPPAGGMGIGIDRLVMMLTGAESIRDVILFPLLRPQAQG